MGYSKLLLIWASILVIFECVLNRYSMKLTLLINFIFIGSIYSFSQSRGTSIINHADIPEGNTYAIVIGISNYKNLPPLQYADKDAKVFYDYLVSEKGMNIDSANVLLTLNENASIDNIGNNISDLLHRDIKKGDKVIFFFAGHGDYDAKIMQDQALLLLHGAPNGNYFQNVFKGDYISTSDLQLIVTSELIKKGAKVILIIDACHSGGMNSRLTGGEQGGIITANAINMIQSTVKLYSCQANQYSIESTQFGGGRGLFSYVMMEGLYGMADANSDKAINLKELQRYLEDNVPKLALPNKQDPVIKIEDNTEIICNVNDELLKEYKSAKDNNLTFLAEANVKGNEDSWLTSMGATQKEYYQMCKALIENNNLEAAYGTYKQYALTDKTSDVSLLLRRELSAALQKKTALILTPMLEDVSKVEYVTNLVLTGAISDLEKAAELLGKEHFLFNKLQARTIFLKALVILLNDENKTKVKDCIRLLEQSASIEPNASYIYFYLSNLYYDINNSQEAEKNITKYLDLIPTSSWAHCNYGYLLTTLKRYEEAKTEYQKAIELNPEFAEAHLNYGILLQLSNRSVEAETEYKKVIKLDPNSAKAHYNYGILLNVLKRFEEAEKEYKISIELNSNYIEAHNNYSLLLKTLKRYNEAEKECQKAIKINQANFNAHFNYGSLLDDLSRFEEAEKEYKKAIELNPSNAAAHNNYGVLLYNLTRYSEAEREYKTSIELNPNNANTYYNMTCVCCLQRKNDKALMYFGKCLQKGLKDLGTWQIDSDLDNIRATPEFKALLLQYYKQQELNMYPELFVVQKK